MSAADVPPPAQDPRRTARTAAAFSVVALLLASGPAGLVSAAEKENPRVPAFLQRSTSPLSDFDIRGSLGPGSPRAVSAERLAALDRLRGALPVSQGRMLRADFGASGLPKLVWNPAGALTAAAADQDRLDLARQFLLEYSDLFGLSGAEVQQLRVVRNYSDKDGTTYLRLEQTVRGVPVFRGLVQLAFDREGRILQTGDADGVVPGLDVDAVPALSDADAIRAAYAGIAARKQALGVARGQAAPPGELQLLEARRSPDGRAFFSNPGGARLEKIMSELRVFPMPGAPARLAYRVYLHLNGLEWYEALLDARSGELLHLANLFNNVAQGKVFTQHPPANGADTRTTESFVGDTTINTSAGWMGTSTVTTGNNVDAYLDTDANNAPDPDNSAGLSGGRASSATQDFTYSWADGLSAQDPRGFKPAAVANLFYLNNIMHDWTYTLGFSEAAGNFQSNNFGRGGVGNDPVNAEAQDGSSTNTSSFATPPDGFRPRMQMFLFTRGTPGLTDDLDGSYDGDIVYHEYGHGVSNRLVGDQSTNCLQGTQSGAMGEGWSDYWPLTRFGDPVIGEYVTQNFISGIRRYAYDKHPWGYAAVGNSGFDVHDDGEHWAATLYDMRQTLGAGVADPLVIAGMKLTVCSPSMLNARDGILQADQNNNGGANQFALWHVFARHGMGNAASGNDGTTHNAAYDIPAAYGSNFANTSVTSIPDGNTAGAASTINVGSSMTITRLSVIPVVTHTFIGDLVIELTSPGGTTITLFNRSYDPSDGNDDVNRGWEVTNFNGSDAQGAWTLRVKDLNNNGFSGAFTWRMIISPRLPPSNLIASAVSRTQINLTWQDNSSDESDFHIERSPNGSSGWTEIGTVAANVTALNDTPLGCGTGYFYRVRAHWHADNQFSPYSNVANATTQACPAISINDASVAEGSSGTVGMLFTVSLSASSAQTVTVAYATANATATAGADYNSASGTLSFAPGETSKPLSVLVLGDTLGEGSETFYVNLTSPTNATIADGQGVGTIIDDDGPILTVNDRTVTEGNSGSFDVGFTVSLSPASGQTVSVVFATADATATAGSDYTAKSGTLTFSPGQTSKTVSTAILGDTIDEPTETFFFNLSNAVNATIVRGQGVGTILDNDAPPKSVLWTNLVGVSASSTGIIKTGANGWNAGAVSAQSLGFGDGFVEFTAAETNTARMAGLGNGNASQHYSDIEYAIYTRADGIIQVYESGTYRGAFGTYAAGDRFRVSIENGVVKYRKNGTVFYTSTVAPAYPLLVDTSLYTTGATVGAIISGNFQEDVTWTNLVGVSATGNSLTKTAATGTGSGVSTKFFASGDGYAEFTATETNTHRAGGLGTGDGTMKYSILLTDDTGIPIVKACDPVYCYGGHLGLADYATGARFRVGVESGVVRYRMNGTILWTSTVAPTYPLHMDAALYTTGSTITNATIGGDLQENVSWASPVGVSTTGNSLTKTAALAWGNAGAVSTRAIASGNGYVEFTATETNTYRMAGLGNGDASQSYTDLEYAVYLRANGTIRVYESGTSRGDFGTYAAGDRFRVGVEYGVVKYRKNGTVFYTSTVPPTYPLLLDTALYTTGATIANATIAGNLQQNVNWTNLVGVSASANSLTKTAANGWDAGAASVQSLASGDGFVEFTATETNTYRMCGLGNGDASQSYTDLEFAVYLRATGTIRVYESGTSRGDFGSYATGDRLRVSVESGVVKYLKNGAVFYTSTLAPTYPLLVDTSLYTTGATITNAVIAGPWQ